MTHDIPPRPFLKPAMENVGIPKFMTKKIKNPFRKWWQFWKPRYGYIIDIEVRLPGDIQTIKGEFTL